VKIKSIKTAEHRQQRPVKKANGGKTDSGRAHQKIFFDDQAKSRSAHRPDRAFGCRLRKI
jgi:hypothetical protein